MSVILVQKNREDACYIVLREVKSCFNVVPLGKSLQNKHDLFERFFVPRNRAPNKRHVNSLLSLLSQSIVAFKNVCENAMVRRPTVGMLVGLSVVWLKVVHLDRLLSLKLLLINVDDPVGSLAEAVAGSVRHHLCLFDRPHPVVIKLVPDVIRVVLHIRVVVPTVR